MGWLSLLIALAQGFLKAMGFMSVQQERSAGAAINQNEANDAEAKRLQRSSDAGLSAQRLPIDTPDPYDRDGH